VHVSALLADVLDPLLTACGFASGQTGLHPDDAVAGPDAPGDAWPAQSGSVLWCAPYDVFQDRCPSLPQAGGQDEIRDHVCVDLSISIDNGRIAAVSLEGPSLTETFAMLGRQDEAQAAERLLGTPAQSATPALAALLTALLAPEDGPSGTTPSP
jgi:hypothetical protein